MAKRSISLSYAMPICALPSLERSKAEKWKCMWLLGVVKNSAHFLFSWRHPAPNWGSWRNPQRRETQWSHKRKSRIKKVNIFYSNPKNFDSKMMVSHKLYRNAAAHLDYHPGEFLWKLMILPLLWWCPVKHLVVLHWYHFFDFFRFRDLTWSSH